MEKYIAEIAGIAVASLSLLLLKSVRDWVLGLLLLLWKGRAPKAVGYSFMESSVKISLLLTELRVATSGDRAYVYQFHNGGKFTSQQPIWRITCTNEVCSPGTSPESIRMKEKIVSGVWELFAPFFGMSVTGVTKVVSKSCTEKKCPAPRGVFLFEVPKMPESMSKSILRVKGISCAIRTPLINEFGDIIGIVGVDYCDAPPKDLERSCVLCETASDIALILGKIDKC